MSNTRLNALDQALDIAGSLFQTSALTLADEGNGLGSPVTGQTGTGASITTVTGSNVTLTGVTGMSQSDVQKFISISGAFNAGNNGTFLIEAVNSSSSITYVNPTATANDSNNPNIIWTERNPYSLQDDLNYERTDRASIKGVGYDAAIPTYQRPTAIGTFVPANLANIAGKTTDAVAYCVNRAFFGVTINSGDTFETITATGHLKHADAVDQTGVPCFDAIGTIFDGDWNSCYVHIVDGYQGGSQFVVLSGAHEGEAIFGITMAGSSTSPDSVEVHFYSAPFQFNYATDATPYAWESGQDGYANFLYGYNERLDELDQNALRTIPTLGILVDAQLSGEINNIINTIGTFDGYDSLAGLLTNLGPDFPFNELNATPTVVDALNVLNQQIGDTTFTGNMNGDTTLLVDGETVTFNLNILGQNVGSNNNYTGGSFSTGTVLIDGYSITQLLQLLGSNLGNNTGYTGGNITDGYSITQSIQYLNQTIGYYGNFTGSVLNDGYSISQNLQQLADSITTSSISRTIEILAAPLTAGTTHTLPGSISYTIDPTDNGQYLWVYTRGVLRHPGPASAYADYEETSATSITFYQNNKMGDYIDYFVK